MHRNPWRSATLLFFVCCCMLLAACSPINVTVTVGQPSPTTSATSPSGTVKPTTGAAGAGNAALEHQIAQSVFAAVNKDRAAAGLPALQWSDALAKSAHQHDVAMMGANQLAHQVPGEPALGERENQQGVQWTFAAENVGFTTDMSTNGALGLHKAMMAEQPPDDGHRQNILTTQANILGVDILLDTTHEKLWLTEDFAKA